jgi:MYXO-CTERM domain-containing protein
MKRIIGAALLSGVVSASAAAYANGRFPNAQQLREPAPGSIVVAGTYGLLLSGNAGTDFQFVCESALFGKALMGSWVDPLLETLPNGTIISGSQNGLRVSRDHGCSFSTDWKLPHDADFVGAGPDPNAPLGTVIDVCPGYDGPGSIVALTTLHASDGSILEHRIYKSSDGAASWSALPISLAKTSINTVLTIDVAPSDPNRLYVSGSVAGQSTLAVSNDGGKSYSIHPIAVDDSEGVTGAYIAAVSPTNADRVYLRVSRRSLADDGSETWDDSLLSSDDAGAHFRDVLRQKGALLGFALSPDGTAVLAGFGDPMVAPIVTSDDALGLYSADTEALVFTHRVPNLAVSCLRWTSAGVYACAKENDPLGTSSADFHVGLSPGSEIPAKVDDFKALLKLRDVRGPLPWSDGMPNACEAEWEATDPNGAQPSTCAAFNACTSSHALSAGAIRCGADVTSGGASGAFGGAASNTAGQASPAGAAASGAANGRGGNTSAPEGGAANGGALARAGGTSSAGVSGTGQMSGANNSSGCNCHFGSTKRGREAALALLISGLLARRRRKNSREAG